MRDDPRFHELERLVERQVKITRDDRGNAAAEVVLPVDWTAVLRVAEELRPEGRDLRLLVLVARALANEHGLAGLADGLALIAKTFEAHWDTMHPELRSGAAPAEAALRRTNALLQLQNGEDGLLDDLRRRPFFAPRGIGPVTGRELERGTLDEQAVLNEAAKGLGAGEKAALAAAHAELLNRVRAGCAAMLDQNESELTAQAEGARAALAALDALDGALGARLGGPRSAVPDLKRFLERVLATLERGLAARAGANGAAAAAPAPLPFVLNGHGASEAAAMFKGPEGKLPDRLNSREDVLRCLDLVVAFYDRTEPSSPIPHLARRIRRMVPMDFIELMEDLAPSGLKEFRLLAGAPDGKKANSKDER